MFGVGVGSGDSSVFFRSCYCGKGEMVGVGFWYRFVYLVMFLFVCIILFLAGFSRLEKDINLVVGFLYFDLLWLIGRL